MNNPKYEYLPLTERQEAIKHSVREYLRDPANMSRIRNAYYRTLETEYNRKSEEISFMYRITRNDLADPQNIAFGCNNSIAIIEMRIGLFKWKISMINEHYHNFTNEGQKIVYMRVVEFELAGEFEHNFSPQEQEDLVAILEEAVQEELNNNPYYSLTHHNSPSSDFISNLSRSTIDSEFYEVVVDGSPFIPRVDKEAFLRIVDNHYKAIDMINNEGPVLLPVSEIDEFDIQQPILERSLEETPEHDFFGPGSEQSSPPGVSPPSSDEGYEEN
jgi:hypothetical protein